MSDPCPVVLYDTGHVHPVVRGVVATIGSIAGLIFLDTVAASVLGVSLNDRYPHGKLIALCGSLALTWFCFLCVIGRNQVLFDRTANLIVLRGPGCLFLQRDICLDASKIVAVVLRHGWAFGDVWNIELRKIDGRRRWLTQEKDEAAAREVAQRIGEAVGKPVE